MEAREETRDIDWRLLVGDEWAEWYAMTPCSGSRRRPSSGRPTCNWEDPLTPSPILKVLFTLRKNSVRSLLMGGQACVLYGAAEFSRDTDVVVLSDDDNLDRLGAAVEELRADVIAVPPFAKRHLEAGHAVHFRCHAAAVEGMRSTSWRGFAGCRVLSRSGTDDRRSRPTTGRSTCSRSRIW